MRRRGSECCALEDVAGAEYLRSNEEQAQLEGWFIYGTPNNPEKDLVSGEGTDALKSIGKVLLFAGAVWFGYRKWFWR